jgi:membrane protease subunit HflK
VRASLLALAADAGLIVMLYSLSRLTGSTVLLADALHSVGDLGVTSTVLIAILVSHRFLSRMWGRFLESMLGLGIALLLGWGAIELLGFVVANPPGRFVQARDPGQVVAFAGVSVALVVTFSMARYKRRIGRQLDSPMFEAEGVHTYGDFLTSFGVWCTLLVGYFGLDIERWMTGIIGLVILKMALELVWRTVARLRVSWPAPLVRAAGGTARGIGGIWHRLPARLRAVLKALFAPQWPRRLGGRLLAAGQRAVRALAAVHPPRCLRQEWIEAHARPLITAQIALILLLYAGVGFYTVQAGQRGVELGLGRVVDVRPAGLHLHLPPPFGGVRVVDADLVSRLELGFRTDLEFAGPEPAAYLWEYAHSGGRYAKRPLEAITLAGDENLIDTNLLCYYRIVDPVRYRLQTRDPRSILRAAFAHEVHAAQRERGLDAMLIDDRGPLQDELLERMQRRAATLDVGVEITRVCLLEAHPPLPVVPQYRAVVSAKEAQNEVILRAQQYANELVPRSRGQAEVIVQTARADSTEQVAAAVAGAERFRLRQEAFSANSAIHRVRLRWEALEEVMAGKPITVLPASAERRVYLAPGGEKGRDD